MIQIQFAQDVSRQDMRLPSIPRLAAQDEQDTNIECLSEHVTCRPE